MEGGAIYTWGQMMADVAPTCCVWRRLLRVAGASGHGRAVVAQNGQAETAPAGGYPARRPARWGCRGSCGHRLGDEGTEPRGQECQRQAGGSNNSSFIF